MGGLGRRRQAPPPRGRGPRPCPPCAWPPAGPGASGAGRGQGRWIGGRPPLSADSRSSTAGADLGLARRGRRASGSRLAGGDAPAGRGAGAVRPWMRGRWRVKCLRDRRAGRLGPVPASARVPLKPALPPPVRPGAGSGSTRRYASRTPRGRCGLQGSRPSPKRRRAERGRGTPRRVPVRPTAPAPRPPGPMPECARRAGRPSPGPPPGPHTPARPCTPARCPAPVPARRLFEPLGHVPPAEFEAHYDHPLHESAMAA